MRGLYLEYVRKDVSGRRRRSLHLQPFIDNPIDLKAKHVPDAVLGAWPGYDPTREEAYENAWDAFERSRRSLLILGHPGAGKTTEMMLIAEKLLEQATAENDVPVPVIVNLSKFQFPAQDASGGRLWPPSGKRSGGATINRKFFEDWFVTQMTSSFKRLDEPTARRWLEEDRIAILLDGLDEFDDARRADLVKLLNATFLADHIGKPMVICSRINEYRVLQAQEETTLKLEGSIELRPLSPDQVNKYLEVAGATKLMHAVRADPQLEELSRTPLMLAVLAMAYGGSSTAELVREARLSDTRFRVFEAYVARMLQRQAQRREQDRAVKDVPASRYLYSPETIDRCLGWLAVTLSVRMRTSFSPRAMMRILLLEHRVEPIDPAFLATYLTLGVPMAFSLAIAIAPVVPFTLGGWLVAAGTIAMAWMLLPVFASLEMRMGFFFFRVFAVALRFGGIFVGGSALSIALSRWLPLTPYQIAPLLVCLFLLPSVLKYTFLTNKPSGELRKYGLTRIEALRIEYVALLVATIGLALAIWLGIDDLSLLGPWGSVVVDRADWLTILAWLFISLSSLYASGPHRSIIYRSMTCRHFVAAIGITALIAVGLAFGTAFLLFAGIEWQAVLLGCCSLAMFFYGQSRKQIPYMVIGAGGLGLLMCGAGAIGGLPGLAATMVLSLALANVGEESFPDSVRARLESGATYAFDWLDTHVLSSVALVLLAAMRRLPFRSEDFVRAAVGAFLLKNSAEEVEFIHRFLRDHFALRKLLPQLRSGDDGRLQAIAQLGYQGQAALDTLVEIAGTDDKPACRAAAIAALGHIPSPEASRRFELSVADRTSEVRYALIQATRSLPGEERTKLFNAMEPLEDCTEVRALFIFGPGYRDGGVTRLLSRAGKAAVDELLRALNDEKMLPKEVAAAATYLAELDDDRITPALCALLASRDGQVKGHAAASLMSRGGQEALNALREHADDPDREFREQVKSIISILER